MSKIYEPLDDFKPADLPEKKLPFWKIAGPGAILVGLSIGAGEIIIWPRIVAQYGASMIWAAVVGIFLQLWINFEVGRWTIATGETVYTGYSRVWRGFAPIFILLTFVGSGKSARESDNKNNRKENQGKICSCITSTILSNQGGLDDFTRTESLF